MTNRTLTEVSSMDDIANLPPNVTGVRGFDLTDAAILRISECSFLEELDLSGCDLLTDRSVIELRNLLRLEAIDLSLCNQITDRSVMSLARLPVLRRISLNWCYNITDAALVELAKCVSLEAVSLLSCEKVTDAGVEALSHLLHLKEIDLPGFAKITDAGLNALASNALNLGALKINQLAALSDAGVFALRTLKHLTKLTVEGCQGVSETGISSLQSALPNCQITFRR